MNIKIGILFTCGLILTNIITSFAQSAREIADKASNAIEFPSMEMTSTLKIYDAAGRERVRQIATAAKKFDKVTKSIIKFTAPADVKGTAILVYDNATTNDDMWIYMPALRKNRRIVSNEKGKSFMGSEFTNADMSKPNLDDFTYSILKEESLEGKPCWVIEATAKNTQVENENGFKRQLTWIEKDNFLSHRIEFYDLDNQLAKVQLIKDYRKQSSGGWFAFYMEKENVQNKRKSVMIIDKFQEGCALPESYFSPNQLGQ